MTTTATTNPTVVSKESIEGLSFPVNEVLNDPAQIKQRMTDLERALSLGNLEHSKIRINFEDSAGLKQVDTTIWGITDKRVILKQGVVIPINRIHSVRL